MSTSDIIAIAMGFAQILVAVAVGIWTVRRTAPRSPAISAAVSKRHVRGLLAQWFRSSWLFLLGLVAACWTLWSLSLQSEAPTSSYVLRVAAASSFAVLNLIGAFGFFMVELLLGFLSQTLALVGRIIDTQGTLLTLVQKPHPVEPAAQTTDTSTGDANEP